MYYALKLVLNSSVKTQFMGFLLVLDKSLTNHVFIGEVIVSFNKTFNTL